MALTAVMLLIVTFPLPRHWLLLRQTFPGVYYENTSLNLYLSDGAVFLLLLGAGRVWRRPLSPLLRWLVYPLGLLSLLTAVSVLWALDLLLALQQAVRVAILLGMTLAIIHLKPERRLVQAGLAAMLVIQATAALLQFARQDDLGLRWLGEVALDRYPGGGSLITVGDQVWLRGYGLTSHPNILGGVLATAVLILYVPLLKAHARQRPFWVAAVLLGMAGLLVTFSRSAWLGGLAGGVFFVVVVLLQRPWRRRYGRPVARFLLVGALFAAGLFWWQRELILARFGGEMPGFLAACCEGEPARPLAATEVRSVRERQALIDAAMDLIDLAPLTGVGAGNFAAAVIPAANTPDVAPQPVHHVPLLLAAELGPLGGLLWLWLMLFPVGAALIQLRRGRLTLWALGLTAALLAFAVIDLFDYYAWGWMAGRQWRWLLWGLWGTAVSPVMHGVTPIQREQPGEAAIRDVLVIGYKCRPDHERPS